MTKRMLRVAGVALLCAATSPAMAATIIVQNGSFEAQPLADGQFTAGVVTGWAVTGGGAGAYNPEPGVVDAAADGMNVLYLNTGIAGAIYDGTARQVVAAAVEANSLYTLGFALARRNDPNVSGGVLVADLLAGDAVLASRSFTDSDLALGRFQAFTLSYTSGAAQASPLAIQFRSIFGGRSFTQTLVDGVRLDVTPQVAAPVPEPATWALMVLGFGAVGGVLRRHNVPAVAA